MPMGSVFENNRTQAVRLPAETRFPKGVKRVHVRMNGPDRILSPSNQLWDSFFRSGEGVSGDFMAERPGQHQQHQSGRTVARRGEESAAGA